MSDGLRCRYALVKYAHDPLRHEPVNVGVVIWRIDDPTAISWRFDGTMKRVEKLYPSAHSRAVAASVAAFKGSVERDPGVLDRGFGGAGSILITEPRAVRCDDVQVELDDLFDTLVEPAEGDADEPREKHRSTRFIKGRMNEIFKGLGVFERLATGNQKMRRVRGASGVDHTFDFAYRNGAVHWIDALSFDHGQNADRVNRARSFANLAHDITTGGGVGGTIEAVVQTPTEALSQSAYEEARKILNTVPSLVVLEMVSDGDLERFCRETAGRLHD